MNVELIYDADCPNVAAARSLLIKAFTQTGVSARWKEWERASPGSPAYVQGFGSPTILVDGNDIAGISPTPGTRACRVYSGGSGNLQSVPPVEMISAALLEGAPANPGRATGKSRWQAVFASFPAIGTALLPKLTCPLCFPAYAALLSAMGLEFIDYTPYLLPLTIVFLAIALGTLVAQAKRTGRWGALLTGVTASAIVVLGKFAFELDWLTTAGIGLLIVAILFSMRKKAATVISCPACVEPRSEAKAETP
jgi:mercuric ion transport protein